MNRIYTVVASTLLLAACAAPQPKLTTDARLELDPNKPPAGTKLTTVTPEEWAKQAAVICARPDFQCIQSPIDVSLLKEDGSKFHTTVQPPTMTIQNGGNIYILAGQTLNVEADIVDGKLTNMHLVETVAHPEKTLIVKLVQVDKPTKALNTMLTVHNPFDKPLKYSAGMMLLTGTDGAVYATDTCPVPAKIMGLENWPMPIFQLILTDFHVLDSNAKMACDY